MHKGITIILIVIVLLLSIAIGGIGYFLYKKTNELNNNQNNNKIEKVEEKKEELVLYKSDLESITLNVLSSKGVSKMMKLNFTLKYSDPLYAPKIEENKTEIIDSVISLISSQNSESLLTNNGKNLLKEELLKEINKIFEKENIKIKQLLFTEFVIK